MASHGIVRSTPVYLVTIYILSFTVIYLIANFVAYGAVLSSVDSRLTATLIERYREIQNVYAFKGAASASSLIQSHSNASIDKEYVYALVDRRGNVISGIQIYKDIPYGYSIAEPDGKIKDDRHYKFFRGTVGHNDLIVGVNYDDIHQMTNVVLIGFGWATLAIALVGGASAGYLAYRTRRRLVALMDAAEKVGLGDLSSRLPVSARADELDVLSTEMNAALARLEASVGALNHVTTNIAHDLKTPIGRVYLILDDALNMQDVEAMKEGVAKSLVEVQGIANTFEALLRIAQLEARNRTTHFQRFNLRGIVDDVYDIYLATAQENGYRFETGRSRGDCWITGDPDLLRQMLANLVSNALRHTPPGSMIELDLDSDATPVRLSVSDNGPGIPAEEHHRIFDRFYRLDRSRTAPGNGLGLSLVKAIAAVHGAALRLTDNGPGLRVTVEFLRAAGG